MLHHILLNAAGAAAESSIQLSFSPDAFLKSLPMMGKGMLGIFIVIIVIYLVILLFNRVFKPRKKDK